MCYRNTHAQNLFRTPQMLPAARRGKMNRRAFSLIEVMVVVVIIGMLAGAVAWKVAGSADTARQSRARHDIAEIVNAVEVYYLTHHAYPTNEQGIDTPELGLKNKRDPWGKDYQYITPGRDEPYEVMTYGADGREGGEGINADIYSWQLNDQQETSN